MRNNWLDGRNLLKIKEFKKRKVISFYLGSRMVFDEVTGDYAPRHGAKSVKKNKENAEYIMEVKEG